MIRIIGSVFSDPEALLLSFRKKKTVTPTKEELRAMEVDMDKDTDEKEMEMDSAESTQQVVDPPSEPMDSPTESEPSTLSDSYINKVKLKDDEITLDLESLRRTYTELFSIPGHPFQAALVNALIYLSRSLEMDLRYYSAYDRDPNYLNIFMIIMEIPVLHSPEYIETATPLFCKAMGHLPAVGQVKMIRVWCKYPKEKLKDYVDCLQQLITVKVITTQWTRIYYVNDDDGITGAARVMKMLYYASILGGQMDSPELIEQERVLNESADENLQDLLQGAVGREPKEKNQPKEDPIEKELGVCALDCRRPLLPWDDFVNEPLCDHVEMDKDYTYYKSENESKFSFMTHSFLLTTAVKNLGMYYDNRIRMMNERRASLLQSLVHGAPTTPYLRLRIRRDHIIDDALVAVS